ncbi:MAG TPA: ThiF family adenylyltransferase [Burkholderiaceae bacterium]|nr:ThiF family adenylyltransferase [Burkholderiaceae bacterium]
MSATPTPFDTGRHARHRMIDWFDADALAAARVVVLGAGAIGNEVCKALALLGVGRIEVWDRDRVERHNLTRSVLFRDDDVGRPKAEVVARRTAGLDPSIRVEPRVADVAVALRASALDGATAVFGCLDNFEARLRANELCLIAGVDLVDGAIDARHASVEHFPFSAGRRLGCYECGLPPSAYGRIAERYSCGGLRRAGLAERKVPTTVVTSSIAGALMVSWGLRMGPRADAPPVARRALIDAIDGRSRVAAIVRADACPCCGPLTADALPRLRWRAGAPLELDEAAAGLRVRLPEPVVFGARCAACGADARDALPAGSRLRAHDTDARRCRRCGAEAVAVDGRDAATLGELLAATGGRPPALPFLWIDDPRTVLCMEIAS